MSGEIVLTLSVHEGENIISVLDHYMGLVAPHSPARDEEIGEVQERIRQAIAKAEVKA